jgi:hypothetical protein
MWNNMDDNRYCLSIIVLAGVVACAMLPVAIYALKGTEPPTAVIGIASTALGALLALLTGPRPPQKGTP